MPKSVGGDELDPWSGFEPPLHSFVAIAPRPSGQGIWWSGSESNRCYPLIWRNEGYKASRASNYTTRLKMVAGAGFEPASVWLMRPTI